MPLDNGSRFKAWTETFVGSLFSVYGVVIGLNLVLLLFPIVDGITIFTPADFDNIVARGILPSSWSAALANHLMRFMMILALFALFKTIIQIVSSIIGRGDGDVINRGERALKESKKLIKTASSVVTGKVVLDGVKAVKDTAIGFIPGSAVVQEAADFFSYEGKKRKLDKAIKSVKNEINTGDNTSLEMAGKNAQTEADKAKEAREKKEKSRKKK